MIVATPAMLKTLAYYSREHARRGVLHLSEGGAGCVVVTFTDREAQDENVRVIDAAGASYTDDGMIVLGGGSL